ncbi:MAG: caspase family protein [Rubrivivax sp.]|nr:caspase family protein [Rubrivivax sp.]
MPAFRHFPVCAALFALGVLALAPIDVLAQEGPGRPAAARHAAGSERAAARLALVIGNAAYKEGALANPANDARAMAEALRAAGFKVMLHTDLDQRRMTQAVREFGDALRKAGGVGLFYFAGHGVQIKGRNYLVPIGADIQREDEVAYAALDAQAVLDKMDAAGNGTNVLILDACRNNPFARSFRSGSAGLAQMDAPVGTLVAFATAPGTVASDGAGSNGLYTHNLLEAMRKPGLKVEDVFKQVRVAVRRDSGGKQVPWESTSLEGDLYFIAPSAAAVVAANRAEGGRPTPSTSGSGASSAAPSNAPSTLAAAPPTGPSTPLPAAAPDEAMWQAIQASAEPVELRAFLRRFPQSRHAEEARRRLAPATPAPAVESLMPEPPPRLALAQPAPAAPPRAAGHPHGYAAADTWSFQVVDVWRGAVLRNYTLRLARATPAGELVTAGGSRFDEWMRAVRLDDAAGDRRREYAPHLARGWEHWRPGATAPVKFSEALSTMAGKPLWRCEHEATVRHVRVEKVRVPAGEFNARRYEIEGTCQRSAPGQPVIQNTWKNTVWYVPELRYYVALEVETRTPAGQLDVRTREELTSFQVRDADVAVR